LSNGVLTKKPSPQPLSLRARGIKVQEISDKGLKPLVEGPGEVSNLNRKFGLVRSREYEARLYKL
jgi:hypothetical protein